MSAAASTLAKTLSAPLPREIAELPAEHLDKLDQLLVTAISNRAASMDRAINNSLKHAPRLARPAIKKVLGL